MKCSQADAHLSTATWSSSPPAALSCISRAASQLFQASLSAASASTRAWYSGSAMDARAHVSRAAVRLQTSAWDRKGVGSGCVEVASFGMTFMPDTVGPPVKLCWRLPACPAEIVMLGANGRPLLGRTEKCRTRIERPAPEWMPVYRRSTNEKRISGTRSATDRYPTV